MTPMERFLKFMGLLCFYSYLFLLVSGGLGFLKAYVLGFAAFAIVFRREIFEARVYNRLFLTTLFLSAGGRLLTVLVNGKPNSVLIFYMITEFTFGFCILAYSRITLARAGSMPQ